MNGPGGTSITLKHAEVLDRQGTLYIVNLPRVPMQHKPPQVERYKRIPEGGRLDIDSLPKELLKGYRTDEVKNFSNVLKRLDWSKPSHIGPGAQRVPNPPLAATRADRAGSRSAPNVHA